MLSFFGSRGKRLVGVDFGASALKIVSGKMQGSKFSIDGFSVEELSDRVIDDRGIQDPQSVLNAVTQALNVASNIGEKAAFASAVHGSGVYTKRIILPKMKKSEIPDAVKWEAEQVLPQDLSTILVDHILLGEVSQIPNAPKGSKGWEILLVGVHTDDVSSIKDITTEAGLDLRLMDLDSFAVGDLLESMLKIPKKKPVALVDIGATATRVGIRHQGNTVYVREFPLGGRAFTEAIAAQLGVSFEDAELLKRESEEAFPQEALDSLASVFQEWKQELTQTEDIFVSQESDSTVHEWHLLGGGSLTPGLLDSMDDGRFGDRVKLVPFGKCFKKGHKSVDADMIRQWAPRLFTAAGLGCRSA